MVAITVTPLIERVVFLRRIGRICLVSFRVRSVIMSAFEGTFSRWYLAAVLIFRVLTWFLVGVDVRFRVSMISRRAF